MDRKHCHHVTLVMALISLLALPFGLSHHLAVDHHWLEDQPDDHDHEASHHHAAPNHSAHPHHDPGQAADTHEEDHDHDGAPHSAKDHEAPLLYRPKPQPIDFVALLGVIAEPPRPPAPVSVPRWSAQTAGPPLLLLHPRAVRGRAPPLLPVV